MEILSGPSISFGFGLALRSNYKWQESKLKRRGGNI